MIEEFQDWLVRKHKVDEDLASDMHDAAYASVNALRQLGLPGEFDGDEMVSLFYEWQREVGEI